MGKKVTEMGARALACGDISLVEAGEGCPANRESKSAGTDGEG